MAIKRYGQYVLLHLVLVLFLFGCNTAETPPQITESEMLALPELTTADSGTDKLKVVVTTSVMGDVVAQVGGDAIELTTLLGPGQDSHSYEPTARALTAVADADVLFVNGWNLEESLLDNLATVAEDTPIVAISAQIEPLVLAEEHEEEGEQEGEETHEHEGADPHVWLDPHNALQWVDNVALVLSTLDEGNAAVYQQNAAAYKTQLNDLISYYDQQVATLPAEKRKLVTNHDAFGYFAGRYGFEVIGTVIPSISTLAEPSANDMFELVETMKAAGVCTIFTETSANAELAEAISAELTTCTQIQVLPLYTESIGTPGSQADSYIGMMRTNVETIVNGLMGN